MSAKMGCSQSSCGAPGLPNTDFDGCSLDLSSIDSMDCEYPSVLPNEAVRTRCRGEGEPFGRPGPDGTSLARTLFGLPEPQQVIASIGTA